MSKSYLNTQQSKGNSIVSRRWKVDVKDIVNNYNFHFHHAHANGGKCELCGNNLDYVAVIEGNSLVDSNTAFKSVSKVMDVGFDCLQLVFGRNWNDYRKAKHEIDKLKKLAVQNKRRDDYAERYKDIINWFNHLSIDYIQGNHFLSDMKMILETGSRVFTINMEGALRRFMGKTAENIDEYDEKLEHLKTKVIPNIEKLLAMIVKVDNINDSRTNIPAWSSYNFVNSVYRFAKNSNKITANQINALKKVYSRYSKKDSETVNKPEVVKYVDMSNIPF